MRLGPQGAARGLLMMSCGGSLQQYAELFKVDVSLFCRGEDFYINLKGTVHPQNQISLLLPVERFVSPDSFDVNCLV